MSESLANFYQQQYSDAEKRISKYAQAYGMFTGTLKCIEKGHMTNDEIRKRIEAMEKDIWNQIQDKSVTILTLPQ
jgi:uncharacterized protein YeeX (DUF496 family)